MKLKGENLLWFCCIFKHQNIADDDRDTIYRFITRKPGVYHTISYKTAYRAVDLHNPCSTVYRCPYRCRTLQVHSFATSQWGKVQEKRWSFMHVSIILLWKWEHIGQGAESPPVTDCSHPWMGSLLLLFTPQPHFFFISSVQLFFESANWKWT